MQVFSLTIFSNHITSPNENIVLNKYSPFFYVCVNIQPIKFS